MLTSDFNSSLFFFCPSLSGTKGLPKQTASQLSPWLFSTKAMRKAYSLVHLHLIIIKIHVHPLGTDTDALYNELLLIDVSLFNYLLV